MAYSLGMYVCKRAEQLIYVDLNLQDRHGGFHFVEEARGTVDGFRNELQHEI